MTDLDVINKLDDTLRISRGVEDILFVFASGTHLDSVSADNFSYGVNLMYEILYYCNQNLKELREEIEENHRSTNQ
ncbi:MAG: hypothetical protein K2F60_02870 [Oscillospiraceae bacterium]|nr:hypothetical protein [Oscillospiraceae bacterium]MDE6103450.1 hypothetical protein [Oscillospiraceae bacterium]